MIDGIYRLQYWMGGSSTRQNSQNLPAEACRVMQVLTPELQGRLHPFTDYIVSPGPEQLRRCRGESVVKVFSILDYSTREQVLPINQSSFGARIKVGPVTDCALRVTKVFANSPCDRAGVMVDDYIVGLLEADFTNITSFVQVLKGLIAGRRDVITLAVCNQDGATRLAPIPLALLENWRASNQGLLGCELAEGWMHRFKPKSRKSILKVEEVGRGEQKEQKQQEAKTEQKQQQVARTEVKGKEEGLVGLSEIQKGEDEGSQQSQELQRKVGRGVGAGGSIEVNFKGLLKNEYLEDASTICRCKMYDKNCERCWVEREGSFHFFNRKTHRIVAIPSGLLLRVGGE